MVVRRKLQELFTSPGGDAVLLRLSDCHDQGTGSIHELGKFSCAPNFSSQLIKSCLSLIASRLNSLCETRPVVEASMASHLPLVSWTSSSRAESHGEVDQERPCQQRRAMRAKCHNRRGIRKLSPDCSILHDDVSPTGLRLGILNGRIALAVWTRYPDVLIARLLSRPTKKIHTNLPGRFCSSPSSYGP
jgi:hypothetical protein